MTQTMEKMELTLWKQYWGTYWNFVASVTQVRILTLVTGEVLRDFPDNLPYGLQDTLLDGLQELHHSLDLDDLLGKGEIAYKLPDDYTHIEAKLVESTFALGFMTALRDAFPPQDDGEELQSGFERLLGSQALIMTFAYLDAFMADTLRIVCKARPEILRSEKKIDWATALSFESREDLLLHLSERYVFEFGWLNLPKRLNLLHDQIGLDIPLAETDVEFLDYAENVRHTVVHNGGRISQEFIERTRRYDLTIDEFIPISLDFVDEVLNTALALGKALFDAVGRKFLL